MCTCARFTWILLQVGTGVSADHLCCTHTSMYTHCFLCFLGRLFGPTYWPPPLSFFALQNDVRDDSDRRFGTTKSCLSDDVLPLSNPDSLISPPFKAAYFSRKLQIIYYRKRKGEHSTPELRNPSMSEGRIKRVSLHSKIIPSFSAHIGCWLPYS